MSAWSQMLWQPFFEWRYLPVLPLVAGIGVSLFSIWILKWLQKRRKEKLPPGPVGLPFFGIVHQMEDTLNLEVQKQRQKYGDVLSFNLMSDLYVAVSGYETIKEGFLHQGDAFAGGMPYEFNEMLGFSKVIPFAFEYDEEWIRNKKIIMSGFRKYGYGSARFESNILSDYQKVFSELDALNGQPCDLQPMVQTITSKAIARILFKYEDDDDDDNDETLFLTLLPHRFMLQGDTAQYAFMLPRWLSRIVYKNTFKEMDSMAGNFNNKMMVRLEQHQATLDPSNPRDMMDVLLNRGFTNGSILNNIFVLMTDSVDTVSRVVTGLLLHVTYHPQVQKKIHEELDRVMGASGPVTLSKREELPYFMATLLECYRYADFGPIAVTHTAIRDVYLKGYYIPQGSVIVPNLHSVHYDPAIFPDPDKFDPKHFLKDGKIIKENHCFPYGIGKRTCMGEIISRAEIFLISSNLFLEYVFSFPEDEAKPSLEKQVLFGFTHLPKPFKIRARSRKYLGK